MGVGPDMLMREEELSRIPQLTQCEIYLKIMDFYCFKLTSILLLELSTLTTYFTTRASLLDQLSDWRIQCVICKMMRLLCLALSLGASSSFLGVVPAHRLHHTAALRSGARQSLSVAPMRMAAAIVNAEAPASVKAATPVSVGIVGATGAVGIEILNVLKQRGIPVKDIVLFASARSAGKVVQTPFGEKTITEFSVEAARALDVVFLAVSGVFALEYAEKISEGEDGALVIDNSSAFRIVDGVPLVVPEINAGAAKGKKVHSAIYMQSVGVAREMCGRGSCASQRGESPA